VRFAEEKSEKGFPILFGVEKMPGFLFLKLDIGV